MRGIFIVDTVRARKPIRKEENHVIKLRLTNYEVSYKWFSFYPNPNGLSLKFNKLFRYKFQRPPNWLQII